jgi:hypothetical protein
LAGFDDAFADFLAVDESAIGRAEVLDVKFVALEQEFGVMAGDGSLRDFEHIVRNATDGRLFGFELESTTRQTFTQQDQSRHRLCA